MDTSRGTTWAEAVQEGDIFDSAEDYLFSRGCISGKEQIQFFYILRNRKTNQLSFPIGG